MANAYAIALARVAIVGAGTSGLSSRGPSRTGIVPGTPEAMLPHGLMGHGRALLRVHAPAVLDRILAMGALEFSLAQFVRGGDVTAADDELVVVFCRSTLAAAQVEVAQVVTIRPC